MTVAPHPAAHRRSPSPPAASRNMSATPVRGPQSSCDRGQRLAPAHRRHRKRPPSPLPTRIPSVAIAGGLARQPSAIRQIPIARSPNGPPNLPAVSSLGGFRTPAPGPVPPSQRAGVRNPSPERALIEAPTDHGEGTAAIIESRQPGRQRCAKAVGPGATDRSGGL